jgi:hypothetical protein
MTTATTRFAAAASSNVRAGFAGLAAVVTLTVLAGVTQIAGQQVQEVQLAQARSNAATLLASAVPANEMPLQIIVVTGKRV